MKGETKDIMKHSVVLLTAIVLSSVFIGCNFLFSIGSKPFKKLHRDAELAIANVGGCAVLAAEADFILAHVKESGEDYYLDGDRDNYAPAMKKLREALPQSVTSWVKNKPHVVYAPNKIEIPEHVKIRFGKHASYAWMLIFPTGTTLPELPDGVVQIGESIYLSNRNF